VLIVDEVPTKSASPLNKEFITKTRDTMGASITQQTLLSNDHSGYTDEQSSQRHQTGQTPQSLLYYPEKLHSVKKEECESFNSRVMKNLMK
jgi:hypothetical protein